jgi:hypothetical protein
VNGGLIAQLAAIRVTNYSFYLPPFSILLSYKDSNCIEECSARLTTHRFLLCKPAKCELIGIPKSANRAELGAVSSRLPV